MAGLNSIPAYIRTAKDEQVMEWALIENIQREDLDAIEIALAYQRLMDEYQLTQERMSERVGKKRATVANYLRLLKLPLIYVGGLVSKSKMEEVLDAGFEGLQMARALVHDTDFVNKLRSGELECSGCRHSNYCIGRMYTLEMKCHHCVENLPESLKREIDKAERNG